MVTDPVVEPPLTISMLTAWKDRYIEHDRLETDANLDPIPDEEAPLALPWRFLRLFTGVLAVGALLAVIILGAGFLVASMRDDVVEFEPGTVLVPEPIATTTLTDPPTLGPTEIPEDDS